MTRLQNNMKDAKKYIQKKACKNFPAQELWIRDDYSFWAYDKQDNRIFSTTGQYSNGDIIYNTVCVQDLIGDLIDQKMQEGFKCFAMQI